ncbi:unnamed protein product [Rotaria sp. Silwood1]|nr:unnamed protein product [Rotaria sp. Silwood1]CAF4598443.1 unnamed protein product [Rotaria sp. Silwood1]
MFLFTQTGFTQNLTQTNFTSVMCPQYMGSGTSTRLPVVFRATLTNLTPSSIYRFYIQAAIRSDIGGTNSGAGNPLFISGNPYKYSTGPGLQTAGGYDSVATDASGTCTAWFAFVNTGNARFTADGIWPSGANTVNPSGGTTAIRITNADAPLTIINKNVTARGFKLNQNYPNPFNPETNIEFQIPQNGFVSLKVYNNLGMEELGTNSL